MIDLQSELKILLDELAIELIDNHEQLGMRATGDWIDSVEAETSLSGGKILANDYTEQLTQGRRPGNMPPVDPIERWVNAKLGISGTEGRGIAWAVATKIKNEGTTWYQQGGSDLVDGVITDARTEKLLNDLGEVIAVQINEILVRQTQEIFS